MKYKVGIVYCSKLMTLSFVTRGSEFCLRIIDELTLVSMFSSFVYLWNVVSSLIYMTFTYNSILNA